MKEHCQYLEWDSKYFGHKIACVTSNRINCEEMEQILAWCSLNNIECLYFMVDSDDAGTVRLAEDNRFRLVDIRVTFERQLDNLFQLKVADSKCIIRQPLPSDMPALKEIAKISHLDSRFYYDFNFPASLCDGLYKIWIEKSCNEYADSVFVAEFEGKAVGYISCHLIDERTGQIGLLGVAKASQGKSIAQRMIHESLQWFVRQGIKKVNVVTQGRNCKAQKLYQKCGFLTEHVHLWYHRWF